MNVQMEDVMREGISQETMYCIIFGLIIGGVTNADPICKNEGMQGGKDGPGGLGEIPGRAICPIGITNVMCGREGRRNSSQDKKWEEE